MRPRKINVGDRITFRAATRSDFKVAKRKVVSFDSFGCPQVRYHGWKDFIVRWDEISAVERATG